MQMKNCFHTVLLQQEKVTQSYDFIIWEWKEGIRGQPGYVLVQVSCRMESGRSWRREDNLHSCTQKHWHNDWKPAVKQCPLIQRATTLSVGPQEQPQRRTAHYLVGTGTSVSPDRRTAGASRTNAIIGLSKKSTSPTKTLDASAPVGIFLMKFMSTYW